MNIVCSNRRFFFAVCLAVSPNAVNAGEYQEAETIAAETAEESSVGMADLDQEPRRPRRRIVLDALSERSPFWRDGSTEHNLRLYDFERENGQETISKALAIGTELSYRSGKWRDRISTVVSWHTSNGIDAPDSEPLTGILGPDQSDISVLSRAYLEVDLVEKSALRLYRQDFNMPYLNRNDTRMIPNTHEAYVLRRPGDSVDFLFGHVTKMKQKDSEDFLPMAEVAGVEGDTTGTSVGGVNFRFDEAVLIGMAAQYTRDLFSTSYGELSLGKSINTDWGIQVATQYTGQRSVGDELLGDFDTYSWGVRAKGSYRGSILTAAVSGTGNSAIRKPFGGSPGFSSSMRFDFDRAREDAYRVGLSHNFTRIGFPGIGLIVNYTEGKNAVDSGGQALPDSREIDITADFRPKGGWLKGLWLRVRYADADRGPAVADRRDLRLIINYSLKAS
jgi:hypothetical protein